MYIHLFTRDMYSSVGRVYVHACVRAGAILYLCLSPGQGEELASLVSVSLAGLVILR